jgi:hypothetical protein
MTPKQKRELTNINTNDLFNSVMRNLTIGVELPYSERDYALACAILFLNEYENDMRSTTYAELSYYIILKYCLNSEEYQALLDFTANFGYYPITRKLLADGLITSERIFDQFVDIQLDKFRKEGYIETLHQFNVRNKLVFDENSEIAYVAPTSYGKSSIIIDVIRRMQGSRKKIAIIVPTKSLLMQTYRMIRQAQLRTRVIMHDEMYNDDDSFIAIFTQERCLRLMSRIELSFDLLFIDEAHNLFDDDPRSILLSRLLIRNKQRNPSQKVIYLSPLIDEQDNVRTSEDQYIQPYSIPFNIKEPDIFEFRENKKKYQYNRFVNQFYELGNYDNIFHYIKKNALKKNFLYCYKPNMVEELAKEISLNLPVLNITSELQQVIDTLKLEVHDLFYMINCLEHGVIYLHGKLPDLIKEYIESKFSAIPQLRYLVANSVILEGMNFPIDNLYILNTYKLNGKQLTNLIGRVNRLNTIFGEDAPAGAIHKLLPPVHFVNSDTYNRADGKMKNKIELLRSRIFKDVIRNCTLQNYNISSLSLDKDSMSRKQQRDQLILRDEAMLNQHAETRRERLRRKHSIRSIFFIYLLDATFASIILT